jgi:hypothetical protein
MNQRIEKMKTHLRENKKVYVTGSVCLLVGAATALVLTRNGNKATIDSWKLINWKSPHTSQTIQVLIPPRGNSGNAIQCDLTGAIYPSQNFAAKELKLNPGNLSSHLNGKKDSVKGMTFTKLTENGEPLVA